MGPESTQPVRFLLVDDREQNLVALEALLRRDGLVMLKARSGEQALELLLEHDMALALIDVQMPGMDGFELAELMRGTERTRRVPIIFITAGDTDQQRRFRGYEAGAVDYLQKPIESDILKSKVGVFFELYRQRQEVARQRDELASIIEENKRLLEESRQAATALQDADRRKDEFLATLAHELRNPLAPIRNALQVLQMSRMSDEDNAEVLKIAERQVDHMVRLIDDLLDVSRITSGKIQLQKIRLDLADVIHNAIETSRPLMEAGQHVFTASLPEESLPVAGDAVRLTQVISNLLNNAAKYTPEGGRVSLSVEHNGQGAEIRICDSGLGIPPEMLDRVFNMFTQINRHLNRSQGGLGIGLTLVKRLVELHGGSVGVASAGEDCGAEFLVRLPLAESVADESAPGTAASTRPATKHRILVVDDNADGLNTLRLLLTALGHHVATAQSGAAAIEQLTVFHPEIILLDIGMPGMDGYETARHIRKSPRGQNVLLVALTGWGQPQDRTRTREAGFNAHLVKPIDATTIQNLLDSTETSVP